jgi:hypothetical protein
MITKGLAKDSNSSETRFYWQLAKVERKLKGKYTNLLGSIDP